MDTDTHVGLPQKTEREEQVDKTQEKINPVMRHVTDTTSEVGNTACVTPVRERKENWVLTFIKRSWEIIVTGDIEEFGTWQKVCRKHKPRWGK